MKLSPKLLLRFDDISENMNWKFMDKCELLFDKYNIRPLIGVIPNNQDSQLKSWPSKENFWDKVRSWQKKGWEISMHGYNHIYRSNTHGKDYFGYGGKSEFYGESYDHQCKKIKLGLKKFSDEKIKIRSFFAPNHTYDLNTFKSLDEHKIKYVIDGYGLYPYKKFNLVFIPQLFYNLKILPLGYQSTQIHLNTWSEKDLIQFENFTKRNQKKIICFDDLLNMPLNDKEFLIHNSITKITLKTLRRIRRFFKTNRNFN
tara:strand:- start:91 stop:861 length:771 start_codon:yes stop_codon:yes gene_type:complete